MIVGILKIPEEQLCHLHTEIIAVVVRFISKSREDQEEAETQEISYEEEEVEGILQHENIIDIHNAEDESLLQRFSQTIMQKNKNKK